MSGIRVTYSGLIAFVIGLVSVFTGLAFVLIVTRRLSPEEFGTWALLGTIIGYLLISERIISYWTIRQIARGEEVGKTSISSSTIFSFGAVPFYLLIVFFISEQSNAHLDSLLLGGILVPVFFVSQTLASINHGHKPQAISFGLLVFEISKIPAALIFVYFLELDLNGAIAALLIAYLVRIVVQTYFAKPKIREKFNRKTLRRWLKLSWLPLFERSRQVLKTLDIVIFTVLTGSVIGVAYYAVSLAIANIVGHSSAITQGLSPKILATGSHEHIRENFTLMMYFSIPLLGISVIFAKAGLFALNPLYQDAYLAAIILSFMMFFKVLNGTLGVILISLEKVDIEKNPKFLNLIKSKLFLIPSARIISSSIYLSVFVFILLTFQNNSEFELVEWWAILGLSVEFFFFIFMWIYVNRNTKLPFPYMNTIRYLGATIAFVFVFILTSDFLITYQQSIFDYLPGVILQLAICIGVYLGITYLIDKRTRKLFGSIFHEITKKNNS